MTVLVFVFVLLLSTAVAVAAAMLVNAGVCRVEGGERCGRGDALMPLGGEAVVAVGGGATVVKAMVVVEVA